MVGACSIPKPFIMTDSKNKKDARDRDQVAITTFTGIPVTNSQGVEKYFDFEVGQEGEYGQYARITMDGCQLILDEHLAYIKGDLAEEWREPAIAKLLLLLEVDLNRDRTMS
ncbi:hypothetical protein SPPR111872_12990 [Sphingobacterium prati]